MSKSTKELREICRPKEPEGWAGDFYRSFSIYITKWLISIPISANQVTLGMIAIGLVGLLCLSVGKYFYSILGATLLQISYLLDFVDGEVARYHKQQSLVGIFLDLAYHNIIKFALFVAISSGVYKSFNSPFTIVLGFLAAISLGVGDNLRFYKSYVITTNLHNKGGTTTTRLQTRLSQKDGWKKIRRLIIAIHFMWQSPGLYAAVLVGALTNLLFLVLLFYGSLTPVWLVNMLRISSKELSQLQRTES